MVSGELVATYAIDFSCLSDYCVDVMDEKELFELFISEATKNSPDGYVDIIWMVKVQGQGFKPEYIPGQTIVDVDFLDYFSCPIDVETHKAIDWTTLEVAGSKSIYAGNYIEKVTGWVPDILQTKVSITFLKELAEKYKL